MSCLGKQKGGKHGEVKWEAHPLFEVGLQLTDTQAVYNNQLAEWVVSKGRVEAQEFRTKIARLEDENRRLRTELSKVQLKNEILLDLATSKELDLHKAKQIKRELEQLIELREKDIAPADTFGFESRANTQNFQQLI